ncbi:hypothetical protein AYO38_11535 [bacterium SCGC AG-212-C10]|nr:hypothetical protein AYO38_11535 [bacterium SCGC AG-212-C10]
MRRIGRMVVGFLIFMFLLQLLIYVAFRGGGNGWEHDGPPDFVGPLFLLLLIGVAIAATRFVRRFAAPIGDVMETVERLANGDYSARVTPSGNHDMRALGDALNTMATRLAGAEEQRRAVIADVAHEIRTPLAVVRGNVEAILDGVYPPDAPHLQPVLDEVSVITRLVEDLQTLSSAEAGMLRLHVEPVDLSELAEDTVTSFRSIADDKRISLTVDGGEVTTIQADAVRLREVIANLLTNAIRHTPAGGRVAVSVAGEGARIRVEVRDTGSGIAPGDLPHIFVRYRKSSDSGGSGLGLAIARRLVEAHGGTITARSTVGEGTVIAFTVPV